MTTDGKSIPFDFSSIKSRCRLYIDALDNFDITILDQCAVEGNKTTQYLTTFNYKEQLIEFVINCEEVSLNGVGALILYLKNYGREWSDRMTAHIKYFEKEIGALTPVDRVQQLEARKGNYLRFHAHNYNLIVLIRSDLMELPLPDHLSDDLRRLGLEQLLHDSLKKESKLSHPMSVDGNTIKPTYSCFEDLFYDKFQIVKCVDALRKYRPEKPILGEGLNWTGGTKDRGLIVAWIERMEGMNPPKIKRLSNRKQLVELLNKYFHNLNMGEAASVFDKTARQKFVDFFTAHIPS